MRTGVFILNLKSDYSETRRNCMNIYEYTKYTVPEKENNAVETGKF